MVTDSAERSEMGRRLNDLSENVRKGLYEIPAEKVAAAIMEWHVGAHLGAKGLLLRFQVTPTSP